MNKFSVSTARGSGLRQPLAGECPERHRQRQVLEEVIVTSSRVPMPLRQIGTSVSVITEQEIQQRGFNSLYDILRSQPSVGVSNAGGAGKVTSVRIRGEEGYRTLVLLDGIDISDTSAPQVSPRMDQLLSSGIQRVEILRGPQGLMYGADAGGVVNISTIAPQEGLTGDLSAEGGRYGSQQFAGNLGGGNGTVDFNLSALIMKQTDSTRAPQTMTARTMTVTKTPHCTVALAGMSPTICACHWWRVMSMAPVEYDSCFTVDTFPHGQLQG